jgi:RNA polymerase sigma-70 factor, ECF subfamily
MIATETVSTSSITVPPGFDSRLASLAEHELVAAAKHGQTEALEVLFGRCSHKVLLATRRITKNHEDAEDALQDSLLRAFVHIKDFDGRSSFTTWLTRIAINSALMMLRKRRSAREISMDAPLHPDSPKSYWDMEAPAPNPEKRLVQRERETILREAVRGLRPAIRLMVEIQHLQENSLKEAAEKIGITVSAAKGRLFHAKAALRKSRGIRALGPRRNSPLKYNVWRASALAKEARS